ncbi:MAG: biotin/lipoyl-binding protein, partial [Planctomycetota bacterium]
MILIAMLVCGLTLIHVPYRVSCKGLLMPTEKRSLFAPADSRVQRVFVSDGDMVRAGDLLIQLTSEVLEADLVSAEVAYEEQKKLVQAFSAQQSATVLSADDEKAIQLQAELKRSEIELAGAKVTMDVLRKRNSDLAVASPVDGVVSAFQVQQELRNRPVGRGDLLLEVHQPDGRWQLELEIDEHRSGAILSTLQGNDSLPIVSFVMSSEPQATYQGTVDSVAERIEYDRSGNRLVLRATVKLDESINLRKVAGSEVVARVQCQDQPLGYVLFGDLIDFFWRTFW